MDSANNPQIEMLEREGVDPAVLRETMQVQTERKAQFGTIVMAGLMLGLAVISFSAPQQRDTLQAATGPETLASDQMEPASHDAQRIRIALDDGIR